MCAADASVSGSAGHPTGGADHQGTRPAGTDYGTIVVVGGGCYGSYYVRQLARARRAGRADFERLLVVDRDPSCRVAREQGGGEPMHGAPEVVVEEWTPFFDRYLAAAADAASAGVAPDTPAPGPRDAIVPSPLMPHLLYQWLARRAAARWPGRPVRTVPLDRPPAIPWQQAAPDGTHYVSFATWMCPVNCIEPAKCPHTRGPRTWSMPPAMEEYVNAERLAGRPVVGPVVFHCSHRAYGVGMIDTADVVAADRLVRDSAAHGAARVLVATVSHCHGAMNLLSIGG